MILDELKIERIRYGHHQGKHRGNIRFSNDSGEVSLKLNQELCNKIFEICAEGLIETAKEAANNMTCEIIEHNKLLKKVT